MLRGQLPLGGECDVKPLAAEAGVPRAPLYRTYGQLKDEFEQRLARPPTVTSPIHARPRSPRLKDDNTALRQRLTERDREIRDLTEFKTTAISRLAAQHAEIP